MSKDKRFAVRVGDCSFCGRTDVKVKPILRSKMFGETCVCKRCLLRFTKQVEEAD